MQLFYKYGTNKYKTHNIGAAKQPLFFIKKDGAYRFNAPSLVFGVTFFDSLLFIVNSLVYLFAAFVAKLGVAVDFASAVRAGFCQRRAARLAEL